MWFYFLSVVYFAHHACYAELSPPSQSDNELVPGSNFTKAAVNFAYSLIGLSQWELFSKDCGGSAQSPINVDTTSTTRVHHPHLFWWNYHRRPQKMTLTNNGHTIVLAGSWEPTDCAPYHWHGSVSGGEVEYYAFDHIHFHWGSTDNDGSEHRLNSGGFSMEMHAVHYNKEFASLADALLQGRGVRVIAVFFMLSEQRNSALDDIVRWLPTLRNPASVISIEPFEIGKLLVRFSQSFIAYNGSLTTPPCTEAVSWILRLVPSTISIEQLEEFRKLLNHEGQPLIRNVRPVKPINGRSILHAS